MAIFPTVPPSTNVCCNDIFSKQARAYLSGSKDDTATTEGDAGRAVPREARHRRTNTTDSSRSPSFVGSEHSRNGLDALAEQACLESSSIRTPPLDRGGSRTADRPERDAEGANGRPTRSRQSKVRALRYLRAQTVHRSCLGLRPDTSFPLDIKAQRDGGLLRAGTPDRRTTTPRPSSSQAESIVDSSSRVKEDSGKTVSRCGAKSDDDRDTTNNAAESVSEEYIHSSSKSSS